MKQKVISLTAESFVCRCHWMYLLVLRATTGVLHSARMEWSLPLPDSYTSTRAANPESNITSTDDPILLQVYHCALPTPHPETVLSLSTNLKYKLLHRKFRIGVKYFVLAITVVTHKKNDLTLWLSEWLLAGGRGGGRKGDKDYDIIEIIMMWGEKVLPYCCNVQWGTDKMWLAYNHKGFFIQC